MKIIYQTKTSLTYGEESSFRDIKKPDKKKKWYLGIDGSSTAYGLALYTHDYSDLHLFIFCRDSLETAESFREILYDWLRSYLFGVPIEVVTYERTPEGYKPPSNHAEKVMRETEAAVRNFVNDSNSLMLKGRDFIFDIFPNSWKSFSIPKSQENLGKVSKELNATAVLLSCGLDAEKIIRAFDRVPYKHDYDCFEALGVGRYGSHFIAEDGSSVRIYKNFTKIGTSVLAGKRIDVENNLASNLEFVGRFGANKIPRFCSLNENHSIPENLVGLYDNTFNNILLVEAGNPTSIYLDLLFGFEQDDSKGYLILGVKSSKTDIGEELIRTNGFTPAYI